MTPLSLYMADDTEQRTVSNIHQVWLRRNDTRCQSTSWSCHWQHRRRLRRTVHALTAAVIMSQTNTQCCCTTHNKLPGTTSGTTDTILAVITLVRVGMSIIQVNWSACQFLRNTDNHNWHLFLTVCTSPFDLPDTGAIARIESCNLLLCC